KRETKGRVAGTLTTFFPNNPSPPLSATNSFSVTVLDANSPPVLPNQPDRTITKLTTLTVTNTATDPDIPANTLTYSLLSAPSGAAIDANGIITWVPNETQSPSTNTITTRVVDDGSPPLSATNSFLVLVDPVIPPPPLMIQSVTITNGIALVTWNSIIGQTYRLQYKDNCTGNSWSDAPPDIIATDVMTSN